MAEQKNPASKSDWEAKGNLKLEPSAILIKYCHLSDGEKNVFFGILKRLLKEPYTLQDNMWDEEKKDGKLFKLIYRRKGCKVSIHDSAGVGSPPDKIVAALDIYLMWRGSYKETLTLKNLQTVQNELKILGVQDEKVHACFSMAKNGLVKESLCIQNSITLIILSEVILSFGYGLKVITVMYDDKEGTPVYYH